jgi:hypothetical protein
LLSPAATQSFCGDATAADLNAGSTTGYTVNWYSPEGDLLTGTEALVTGIYTVSQTSNGCESTTVDVAVTVTAIPDAPTGEATQSFDAGDTVSDLTFDAIDGADLHWYFLDGTEWFSIAAGTLLTDGFTYGVSQSAGDCESEKLAITVNVILGSETFELRDVKVYPNPASDVVNVQGNDTLSGVSVFNLLGQEVIRQSANANAIQLNISSLPQATYIMQVHAANGGTATFKIVKQ